MTLGIIPRKRSLWLPDLRHQQQSHSVAPFVCSPRERPDRLRPRLHHWTGHGYTGSQAQGRRLHAHPYRDSLRGSRNGRNELASILDFIRPGDVLIVVKLDRLGRKTREVLNLVHELEEKGASLRVLEPAIDTGGPMGRMVLTVLGMVAEMELGFIRDRQRARIDAAKAKGIYKGRPASFDRARIVSLRKEGMGATDIANAVGCKRGNVYKTLKAAGLN
jgi:DNA invertase Pin-like site-specific DNA recombinase